MEIDVNLDAKGMKKKKKRSRRPGRSTDIYILVVPGGMFHWDTLLVTSKVRA
jgi:hypothetical protein